MFLCTGLIILSLVSVDVTSIETGQIFSGDFPFGEDVVWLSVDVSSSGLFAVALQGTGEGGDLTLAVYGPDYMEPELIFSDQDIGGDYTRETACTILPRSGTYYVKIGTYEMSPFELITTFAPFGDPLPEDPDGISVNAASIRMGEASRSEGISDSIDGSAGDYRDWFRFTPEDNGLLTISIMADEDGDLILSAHGYENPLQSELGYSDNDFEGEMGNERLVIDCNMDEDILIQVRGYNENVTDSYTLRLNFMQIRED